MAKYLTILGYYAQMYIWRNCFMSFKPFAGRRGSVDLLLRAS